MCHAAGLVSANPLVSNDTHTVTFISTRTRPYVHSHSKTSEKPDITFTTDTLFSTNTADLFMPHVHLIYYFFLLSVPGTEHEIIILMRSLYEDSGAWQINPLNPLITFLP